MLTWGSKFLLGVSGSALIGAIVYAIVTGGEPVGAISAGYKGGVGDHLGYTVLLAVSLSALVLAVVTIITRDGDAEAMAALAGAEQVPAVTPPAAGSYWGIVSAFGVACLVIGFAVSTAFWILGVAVLLVAALQWLVLAWSDRATGDPETNAVIRTRVVGPFEIPMMSMLTIGVIAVGASRVFLAASEIGAVVIGSIVTVVIFGAAVVLSKVEVKRGVMSGIVALGAVAILAGGIAGAAIGQRDFHHGEEHGEEHSDDSHSEGEGE